MAFRDTVKILFGFLLILRFTMISYTSVETKSNPLRDATMCKPSRSVRLTKLTAEEGVYAARIEVAGKVEWYHLDRMANGAEWTFTKESTSEQHSVWLFAENGNATCTCKGFKFHRHCRHASAIVALLAAGKLPGGLPGATEEAEEYADCCGA